MIVVASASPRRRQLLEQIGLQVRVAPHPIDEALRAGEAPEAYVLRMAEEKLRAALRAEREGNLVLAADTSVVFEGKVLGKPESDEHNRAMLRSLSGREHEVITAVAVGRMEGARSSADAIGIKADTTMVRFAELSETTIERYVATGEGVDKAGGYAIQGIGGGFVEAIEGSYSTVVGLPLHLTIELIRRVMPSFKWP